MGVVLGMPGPWADDIIEASDHCTTKIGGLPDWPPTMPALRPDDLNCHACSSKLCLVAQVYAPILQGPLKIEERTIYIFCCTMLNCGISPHSWRVFRVQNLFMGEKLSRSRDVHPSAAVSVSNSKSDWRDNLWSTNASEEKPNSDGDGMDLMDLGRVLSDVASLSTPLKNINKCQHAKTKVKSVTICGETISSLNLNMPVVPCFYIHIKKEASFSKKEASICLTQSSLSMNDDDSDCDDRWEEEFYEYDRALYADRIYLKFKKQVDVCPEQCFRYCYGKKPLLASEMAGGDPGKCRVCGASRHFEMQLMPSLLYFLHEAANDSQKHLLHNWDWLTVLVYTCSENCFERLEKERVNGGWSVAEESVVIQSENPIPWPATAFSK